MTRQMRVDLLSFDDCPNRDVAMKTLRLVIDEECLVAEVTQVKITSAEMAQELQFLGSPSVRINGVDVEPSARSARQFGFMCRTYTTSHGVEGSPPMEMIRAALREQLRETSDNDRDITGATCRSQA